MIVATMGCHRWFSHTWKKGFHISLWFLQPLLLLLADTSLALKCREGEVPKENQCVPCKTDYYWTQKQGQPVCEKCTRPCSDKPYRVEIRPCNKSVNRECHCIQGAFCSIRSQYTCWKCLPCEPGTFTDVTSRAEPCRPHKNCTELGMVTIREGTSTTDSVCGNKTTHPPITASKSPVTAPQYNHKNSTPSTVTWGSSSFADTFSTNAQDTPPSLGRLTDQDSTHYLWLLLFVLLLSALLLAFFKRNGAKWVHQYWRHLLSKYVKDELSLKEEPELSPGGPQQITVGHSTGGDGVNNTVGSIYIYNPGVVVLGSNSPAQREESTRAEELQPLVGTPQQESLTGARVSDGTEIGSEESGSTRPPVVECTEDEYQKELSYPVPATGK